jgi:uncharacterized membrane protein
MATREHEGPRPDRTLTTSTLTRYDLVLAVIPSAFIVAMLLGHVFSLSVEASAVVASVVGMLALLDGLFLNPPGTGDHN